MMRSRMGFPYFTSPFFFASRGRHTRWTGDWIQTCALPIFGRLVEAVARVHVPARGGLPRGTLGRGLGFLSGARWRLRRRRLRGGLRRLGGRLRRLRQRRSEERRVGTEGRRRGWARR